MSVSLPTIGITTNSFTICELLEHHPDKVLGTFWIMCRHGLSMEVPDFWEGILSEDNQAQEMLSYIDLGYIKQSHEDPLYYGLVITVVDTGSFLNFHYIITQIRLNDFEGIAVLQELAKHNIYTVPCIYSPRDYLDDRFNRDCLRKDKAKGYELLLRQSLRHWSIQVWEDYCEYLMSLQGSEIYSRVITGK